VVLAEEGDLEGEDKNRLSYIDLRSTILENLSHNVFNYSPFDLFPGSLFLITVICPRWLASCSHT
jgi:hypothetical protein